MENTLIIEFERLQDSWKFDRYSRESEKQEEVLIREGYCVKLENVQSAGEIIDKGVTYIERIGDLYLCDTMRNDLVIHSEPFFDFRERKNLSTPILSIPEHADQIDWDEVLREISSL